VLQAATSGATPTWTTTPTLTGTNFSGIPNSALTGSGAITVTGGTGLGVTGSPVALGGTLSLSNTGVTSIAGTANQITASVSTGPVTLSLPTTITGLSSVTSTTFVGALTGAASSNLLLTGGSMTGTITMDGTHTVTGLPTPTASSDATPKSYVDSLVSGLEWKASAAVATTANITLSGLQAIDGYTTLANDRVLVKNQTTQSQNGIYVAASGAWTRSTDADVSAELNNATLYITNGTLNTDTGWTQTTINPTIGTSNIVFVQFSGSGTYVAGTGLQLIGNTFSNTGVLNITTSSGLSTNTSATGAVSITNTGVTSNVAGTNISVSAATGPVTISTSATPSFTTVASTVSTGTAPFTVTSTTPVTNLSVGGSAGSVVNALTVNNGGTGAASGSTFNGSAAVTISYNSVGASPLAGSTSLTTTGTVATGTWSGLFGAVSGANLTSLTAANLTGTIPSTVLGNSTVFIGTTSVALNRASGALILTGITSIDGSAATAGTVTTAAQPAITSVGTLTSLTVSGAINTGTLGQVNSATLTTAATTAGQVVASVAIATFRSATYMISITSGAAYHYTEVRMMHDGTNVYMDETDTMLSGASLATFTADISGGLMRLLTTPTNAVTVYKTVFTAIAV
jgi:hypothetical protein